MDIDDSISTSSSSLEEVAVPSSVGSVDGRRTVTSVLMSGPPEAAASLSEFSPTRNANGDDVRNFLTKTSDGKNGNYQWRCQCLIFGYGTSRAIAHIRTCKVALKTEIGKWIADTYVMRKRTSTSDSNPPKKDRTTGSSSIRSYHVEPTAKGTKQSVYDATAEFFILHNMPLSIVESPAFNKMRSEFEESGRKGMARVEFGCAKTFEANVIQPTIERERVNVLELHGKVAKTFGVTVVIDGRKNAAKKAMEAMMIETKHGYALVKNRAPPPGKKKNVIWYLDLLKTNLVTFEDAGPFKPILECAVAVVTDGATAPVNASAHLEKNYGILAVLCQLHALNRLIVHLFEKIEPLKSLMKDVNVFFEAFLDIQRFREYLESKTGKSIFRFVNTRMLYIPIVFGRLWELKSKIKDTVLSEEFKTILEAPDTNEKEKGKARNARDIVRSDIFWGRVHFASTAFLSITLLARELDRGIPNIAVCYWGWYKLSRSLCHYVASFEYEIEDSKDGQIKKVKALLSTDAAEVQRIVAKDMQKYLRPVMAATFMLFPPFHAEREELKQVDRELYLGLRTETKRVLVQLLGRFQPTEESWTESAAGDLPRLNPIGQPPIAVDHRIIKNIEKQLDNFLAKSGPYADANYDQEVDASTWFSEECPDAHLAFLGQRIFQIVPVGSNLERTHKQNTLVHSSKRNRLNAQKVDDVVRAKQSILLKQRYPQSVAVDRHFIYTDDFFRRFDAALKNESISNNFPMIEELRQEQVRRSEADASLGKPLNDEPAVAEDIRVVTIEEEITREEIPAPSASGPGDGGLEFEDLLPDEEEEGGEDSDCSTESVDGMLEDQTESAPRRSGRIRVLPRHLRDFVL